LLRGKSAKIISKFLNISHGTIEFHIKNKAALIDKAISLGFLMVNYLLS